MNTVIVWTDARTGRRQPRFNPAEAARGAGGTSGEQARCIHPPHPARQRGPAPRVVVGWAHGAARGRRLRRRGVAAARGAAPALEMQASCTDLTHMGDQVLNLPLYNVCRGASDRPCSKSSRNCRQHLDCRTPGSQDTDAFGYPEAAKQAGEGIQITKYQTSGETARDRARGAFVNTGTGFPSSQMQFSAGDAERYVPRGVLLRTGQRMDFVVRHHIPFVLAHKCAGTQMCWHTNVLAHKCAGTQMCWHTNVLAHKWHFFWKDRAQIFRPSIVLWLAWPRPGATARRYTPMAAYCEGVHPQPTAAPCTFRNAANDTHLSWTDPAIQPSAVLSGRLPGGGPPTAARRRPGSPARMNNGTRATRPTR
eukprot:gene15528-biopygen14266